MSTLKVTNIKSANGTSALSIANSSGNVTVETGKVFAPNGIVFSSTELTSDDASTTTRTESSNLLNDYEEGTFTPTISNFTVGNGNVFGTYIKIGNIVHCWFGFNFGSTSNFTGTVATISGLPFTILSRVGDIYIKSNGVAWDAGNTWTSMMAMAFDNTDYCLYPMKTSNSAGLSSASPFTWANGDSLTFQLTYETT